MISLEYRLTKWKKKNKIKLGVASVNSSVLHIHYDNIQIEKLEFIIHQQVTRPKFQQDIAK